MNRFLAIVASLSGTVLTACACMAAGAASPKPNILLILADDVGFSDLGCYGSEISTPNLDKLGAEGVRFTQFYNGARCCPTRASLLSGLYPHQAGVGLMAGGRRGAPGYEGYLTDRCATIPELLKPAGYRSYMVGKWHLKNSPSPVDRGFDEFYGMLGGFNTCWEEQPNYSRLPADHPRRSYAEGKFYATDAFGDYALDFLADARRTPGQPWFLYLAFNAAHFPLHAPEEEIAKYEKLYAQGWDKTREQRYARQQKLGLLPKDTELSPRSLLPANWANKQSEFSNRTNPAWTDLSQDRRADLARRMAVYAAMIDRMDQNIGRVLADLREHGQLDNTMVIFLSDNGACAEWDPFGFDGSSGPRNVLHTGEALKKIGAPGSYSSYGSGWANACNTPWRLYKHYSHEGGIATPCIVRWPAGVKAGSLNDTPAHVIDLMPTFLEIAGASYPKSFESHPILPLEGRSLLPVFKGRAMAERGLFFEHEGSRAVREGRWKLVSLSNQEWELYDFTRDRSELHNVAGQQPELVARLSKAWDQWAVRALVRAPKTAEAESGVDSPDIANKALRISCDVTLESTNGVVLAQGGDRAGYALWLRDGRLLFTVRIDGISTSIQSGLLPSGTLKLEAHLNPDGAMELAVNGADVARGKAPSLIPVQPRDGLSIGEDTRSAVGEYESPHPLKGKVQNVRVETGHGNG